MKKKTAPKGALLDECERLERRFSHRGRAVLVLSAALPTGQSAAALQLRAVTEALCAFAERTLLPRAIEELNACIGAGRGYAFVPHRYRIRVFEACEGKRCLLTVEAEYRAGRAAPIRRVQRALWDAAGRFQLRALPVCFL